MRKRAVGQKGEKKPIPNFDTRNAIKEVELAKGTKVKGSQELFSNLGI
ncbi:MAG TPA: hypothetical protein VFC67_19830 [Prolixibacteraceae bacterium]|nr:hypothetical protein [Prolixibacteraceae bacterium]